MRSDAAPQPQRSGRNIELASSGTRPSFTNRMLSLAPSATTMRSNGRIIVRPMPIAGPFTAATIGFVDADDLDPVAVTLRDRRAGVALELRVEHRADVGARAEPATGPGHHQRADGRVGIGDLDRVDQLGGHPRRPHVETLGPVQRQDDDVVVALHEDLLVLHGANLDLNKCSVQR